MITLALRQQNAEILQGVIIDSDATGLGAAISPTDYLIREESSLTVIQYFDHLCDLRLKNLSISLIESLDQSGAPVLVSRSGKHLGAIAHWLFLKKVPFQYRAGDEDRIRDLCMMVREECRGPARLAKASGKQIEAPVPQPVVKQQADPPAALQPAPEKRFEAAEQMSFF